MECNIFIYQIQVFISKAESVSKMILELEDVTDSEIINQVRKNYGLSLLYPIACDIEELVEELKDPYDAEIYAEEVAMDSFEDKEMVNEQLPIRQRKILKQSDVEKNDDEKLFSFKCHICPDIPEFQKMFQLSAHTRSQHQCLPMVKCFCDKNLSTMRGLLVTFTFSHENIPLQSFYIKAPPGQAFPKRFRLKVLRMCQNF